MTSCIFFLENYIAGGSDKIVKILAQKLSFDHVTIMVNKNHDLSMFMSDKLPEHIHIKKYNLATIPDLLFLVNNYNSRIIKNILKYAVHIIRYPMFVFSILYFFRMISNENVQYFIANNGGYPAGDYCRSASIAASFIPRLNVYHIVHSVAKPPPLLFRPFEWVIDRIIDVKCTFITVCIAASKRLKSVRWIYQDPVVIYNGVESIQAIKNYNDNTLKILNVGYFDKNKNQVLLIHAAADLINKGYSNLEINFVGSETNDNLKGKCQMLARELGVEKYINFHDFSNNIENWYQNSDLFVLCSNIEGLPVSIIEAMSASLPIIASNTGGVSELVDDGKTGYVIDTNNYKQLAEKIEDLIINKDHLINMGENGKNKYNSNFTVNHMVNKYMKCLNLKI